jgi:Arc/MetJ-type ribon-helix-helix transcriptional regulator
MFLNEAELATPPCSARGATIWARDSSNIIRVARSDHGEQANGLRICLRDNTNILMKTLTVRLPEALVAQIEAESRRRNLSKSDVVRERLTGTQKSGRGQPESLDAVADIVGSVDGLPRDLSARKKRYLKTTGYGDKRPR